MRADRLLSLLLLLQTCGRMTAETLAAELEVSERTIYRDIDALSAAGVPIYTERGPGGGCCLMDHYRTQLTGLTDDELRALFLLSIPAPLADLGVHADLRGALLKLNAARLPAHHEAAQKLQQRLHLDWTWWFEHATPVPYLSTLHTAVQTDRRVRIAYQSLYGGLIETEAAPYGLVAKAGAWYVVLARHDHVDAMRVSDIRQAQITAQSFTRSPGFDLAAFWENWCAGFERSRPQYLARVRVAPDLIPLLRWHFGNRIDDILTDAGSSNGQGWRVVTLPFESFEAARERILGYGRAVEVLEPRALRCSVIDFAQQIAGFYASNCGDDAP
ncbi:MAG: WYL domain-containing protein [Anaerolineae bacterium]|nr:WYL domain-containing protein [Anaerolineae bacterium]